MADQLNQVFFPSTYAELFSAWERFPHAVPYAGGTGLIYRQGGRILELPSVILSLERLEEMHRISRSERFLEIGAMVNLNRIIDLGKIVPGALRLCLENIAGQQLRNLATFGGNICFSGWRTDCPAALIALDAQFELRGAQSAGWISALRFFIGTCSPDNPNNPDNSGYLSYPGGLVPTALSPGELLTRVRIPLDHWDYSAYKKFARQEYRGRALVFLAKTQKNILSDIRVVYKSDSILRDKNIESVLIGKRLPLSRRIADEFVERWEAFLAEAKDGNELSRKETVNFIETNVYNLTE